MPRAEMAQNVHCNPAPPGLRRGGDGFRACHSGQRRCRDHLGTDCGGRNLLGGDLPSLAETNVGLRLRPRIDARRLDMALWRARQTV